MSESTTSPSSSTAGSSSAAGATPPRPSAPPAPTAWVGWIWFAGILLITVGLFNIIDGLVVLFRGDLYTVGPNGLLVFNLTAWGWVHLIVGALQVVVALPLLRGATWARALVVLLAMLNAVAQLGFLSAYPLWSVLVIALDVLVIWAVVAHGDEMKRVDTSW